MSVSSTRSEFQPIRYDDLVCLNTHGLVWGQTLASVDRTLLPDGHDAHGMGSLFGLTSFTGSLEVTSTEPIVSLSLNFEADPVFSSLPPGELDAAAQGSTAYYFPHLAVGAGWQTTITYINYSPGGELPNQFHFRSRKSADGLVCGTGNGCRPDRCSAARGVRSPGDQRGAERCSWDRRGLCQPFRYSGHITFTARDRAGQTLASVVRTLLPEGHGAHGMGPLFGLTGFTGSLEVTSTEPIVSLSLNFEADPVFSSLPPGELD